MNDIEKKIASVNGSMAIEGIFLTEEDKERMRAILEGEISVEEMVKQLVEKHTVKSNVSYE